jgi:hypothetical protein
LECFRINYNRAEDIIFGDNAILQMVENMSNLRYLQLDLVAWNFQTDPEHVFRHVGRACPRLKYLSIRKWVSLKQQSLVYLSQIKSLVYLDVGQISCFNKINVHIEAMALLRDCPRLRVLRLNTAYPDQERFLLVINCGREVVASRTDPQTLPLRLDVPTTYPFPEPSELKGLHVSDYKKFYTNVTKYIVLHKIS